MRKLTIRAVPAMCLAISVGVWAHEECKIPARASSAEFQQLKQLVGAWQGSPTSMAPGQKPEAVTTEFKLTSTGSAIQENLMSGTPHEMTDMYYDENGRLAMTHYCSMGNQPHMVLKKAEAKQISLEMVNPTPGINPAKDSHMHALTLEFPDANHLTERWTSYQNGKPGETAVFNFTRTVKS